MKLLELASTLKDLLGALSAIVSDRGRLAQQLLEATLKMQAQAEEIAALKALNTQMIDSDAATDSEQSAAIAAEYEGKVKAAEEALASTIADQEAATESIAAVVASISELIA